MDETEFLNATLSELETLSGLDETRWSKYFNGTQMSERTIYRLSESLAMHPSDFLVALNKRRERTMPVGSVKIYKIPCA